MKKKRVRRQSRSTRKRLASAFSYRSFLILTFGVLVVIIAGKVIISSLQNSNILGTTTYLAKGDDSNGDSSGSSGSGSSGNSGSGSSGSEEENDEKKEEKREEVRVESRGGETRIEFRQKTDGGRVRVKQQIQTENGRIRFELKDGETKVKIETKNGQSHGEFTIENSATTSADVAEIENAEEKFKLKIRTRGGRFEFRVEGASTLTNFPLSFNPETNELSVTTPIGIVLVKTLPQVAVQNVLASNVMDRVLGQDVADPDEEPDEEDFDEEEEEIETPEVKVEGFVETLTASQITVSGVTFTIASATKFEGTVAVGSGVEVKGSPQNGTLIARKVELEDEVEPKVKIEGIIESVTDDAIVVSGITFSRSSATRIEGNLTPGQQVEIKGIPATSGALLANKIEVATPGEGMVLTQERGETVFKVKGQKDTRFLNLIPVTFPIEATVSVETGRILSVSRPFLFNIFGFLFRT